MLETLKEMFEESATKQIKQNYEKISVLDYSVSSIYIYDYTGENISDFLEKHGHNEDECSWMISDDINIHIE